MSDMKAMSTFSNAAARQEIVFLTNELGDLSTLLAGLPPLAEVHLLDARQDGLAQMAAVLHGRSGIQTLHLICHGAPGRLQLGRTPIDLHQLPCHTNALNTISNALLEDGQWLIYGCEVAQGQAGRRFVDALATQTGLRVAAASHKVGAAEFGGDWTLDYAPQAVRQALAVPQWQGVLSPTIGDAVIDLGADGKLIKPVQVEGKWYYF